VGKVILQKRGERKAKRAMDNSRAAMESRKGKITV
jgi:hypothetical protein